ncbi:MAG: hypothetical protein KatS3mg111_0473 [Pirellulaceae bacterium]|nr:MAG: hypothetical protein KatS3mg111_0473 [Pirellulaceae bacterium]
MQGESQYHPLVEHPWRAPPRVLLDRDYDAAGNQTKLAANFTGTLQADGSISGGVWDFSNTYTYDSLNRLRTVTQGGLSNGNVVADKHVDISYNTASQLTNIFRYAASTDDPAALVVHSRMGYDQAGRLTSITHARQVIGNGQTWDGTSNPPPSLAAGDLLAAYFLDWDAGGRLESLSSWADASRVDYQYDLKGQLTAATAQVISGMTPVYPLPPSESYGYDATGNRLSSFGGSQSAPGTHNRLQTDGQYNYTYDAEGNMTQRTDIATGAVTEYQWDLRNRLVAVTDRASAGGPMTQRVEFFYDAFDQRTGKRVDADGDGTWDREEIFVWADGQEVLRIVDFDAEGADAARLMNRYLWGAGGGPVVGRRTVFVLVVAGRVPRQRVSGGWARLLAADRSPGHSPRPGG